MLAFDPFSWFNGVGRSWLNNDMGGLGDDQAALFVSASEPREPSEESRFSEIVQGQVAVVPAFQAVQTSIH
jgi:hypothetical protein